VESKEQKRLLCTSPRFRKMGRAKSGAPWDLARTKDEMLISPPANLPEEILRSFSAAGRAHPRGSEMGNQWMGNPSDFNLPSRIA
jgi:hypothetical protein